MMFGMDPARLREAMQSIYREAKAKAAGLPHKKDARPCASAGCFGLEFARGWCYNCYHAEYTRKRRALKRAQDQPHKDDAGPCSDPDCDGLEYARGWCYRHYMASYRKRKRA